MPGRCPNCPGTHRCIQPDGPELADVLIVGERPHPDDNKYSRPLSSKIGKEFDENYLWLAGIRRDEIRVTNTVLCGADGNRKPTVKEIEGCSSHHLQDEIRQCCPSVIVLLGGTACSLVPDINLDIEHGIPRPASLYGWDGVVVPMYHPAAGLHDTSKMIPLLEDFTRLGKFLRGQWSAPTDPYPNPDYRLIQTPDELEAVIYPTLGPVSRFPYLAIDTERHGSTPFSIQFSYHPGTGYMLLCDNPVINKLIGQSSLIPAFDRWASTFEVVLHNAPQDLDWLDRMGVKVNRFRDTMQEAYHLGNVPQGLKALAYRLFGVRMRSYEDVVIPHSRAAMQDWLASALAYSRDELTYHTTKQLKTKLKHIDKPSTLERGFGRIWGHMQKSIDYDPWDKVAELFAKSELTDAEKEFVDSTRLEGVVDAVVRRLTGTPGPYPIAGIGNVPLTEAVRYGCADADFTLRVALELERRREEAVSEGGELAIAEGDEDQ